MSRHCAGSLWDWPLQSSDGVVRVTNTHDKFEVGLDMQHFAPNEIERLSWSSPITFRIVVIMRLRDPTIIKELIEVKVNGQDLLINCHHEVRSDTFDTVSREITRSYKLPADVDCDSLKSHLSSKGVLTINATKKPIRA